MLFLPNTDSALSHEKGGSAISDRRTSSVAISNERIGSVAISNERICSVGIPW